MALDEKQQLAETCALWVQAVRDCRAAEVEFEQAQACLTGARARVTSLSGNARDRAQIGPTRARVFVWVPVAKCGVVLIEQGRIVELGEDEVVGMPDNGPVKATAPPDDIPDADGIAAE